MADERENLRAADADRQVAADRLRHALDEGRLDFHEYDGRLREAYAAKTYGDLDRLLADLPGPAPAERSALAPVPRASPPAVAAGTEDPSATRRWLVATWDDYVGAVTVCIAVWLSVWLTSGESAGFWPVWVAGPWGGYLVYETVKGLATGEPQRWAAKEARRRAAKQQKRDRAKLERQRRERKRHGLPSGEHRVHDDPDAAEA